jgi:hypothetical protein
VAERGLRRAEPKRIKFNDLEGVLADVKSVARRD